MVITSDWLFLHDACNSEVKKFERHFPDGVRATAEDLDKAHELGFSVDWLAKHQDCPAEFLTILAQDSNSDVRYRVARNSSTPGATLEALAKDSNSAVKREALKSISRREVSRAE